ncbi:carboxypeptidase-like regulatory domain-containing protein [Luteibacter sp. NPDC031894]|uniref:carboxypeptidase-like regulatory domain-containing protein n=1 Tax=Luteibacter sp. NPDC031894 TaxID=3390572 RepID=UPI003D091BF8
MKVIGYRRTFRHIAVLIAMGVGAVAFAPAQGQATTGSIFGHGPAGATVTAKSITGVQRRGTINDSGRYRLSNVPVGTYTVTLDKEEKTVDTRKNIGITVGRGAQIDFACENDQCEAKGG